MSERKLKTCPFCGEEIEHYSVGYTGTKADSLSFQCDKCHLYLQIDLNFDFDRDRVIDAIDIFNSINVVDRANNAIKEINKFDGTQQSNNLCENCEFLGYM